MIMNAAKNNPLVQPYLIFEGRCDEAVNFYRSAVGAEVQTLVRFKEMPNPQPGMIPPGGEDKVMHANLKIGNSTVLMSDGSCNKSIEFKGFSLCLVVADTGEAERSFHALAEGGKVHMPLSKTFFSPLFGMLIDRFGVSWMVYVQSAA
jgi:PhnB protein